jgi:hypothetical protein
LLGGETRGGKKVYDISYFYRNNHFRQNNKNDNMKKYIFILFTTALLSSCIKEKCWQVKDCMGNDVNKYCGSENEVQDYCQANSTPTCTWTYKKI